MPRRSSVSLWIVCFVGPFVFHPSAVISWDRPTGLLTLGAKIRVTTSPNTLRAFLTAGPSLAWVARREAGSRAVAVGGSIGGGAIFRVGARTAFVAEATYRELSTNGLNARWMVPITFGIELR